MLSFPRLTVAVTFALACLCQPLALDACAVSCEAARAARTPSVAAPCHHTTSCATQITQPTSPSSAAGAQALAPPIVPFDLPSTVMTTIAWRAPDVLASASPPIRTQLRL